MSTIEFPKQTRDAILLKLTRYLKKELDLEVDGFGAIFLLDFISSEL